MVRGKKQSKKSKPRKKHHNKYEEHSKVEEVKKELESTPRTGKPAGKTVIVRNIYSGKCSRYRFMIPPEEYYFGCDCQLYFELENDLTSRLF